MTDPTPTTPETPWPPQVDELLPRRELAYGVRDKLATYSLDLAHESADTTHDPAERRPRGELP